MPHPATPEPLPTLLIIDDSPDAIRLLGGMLKGMAQILAATGGETGLALAQEHHPTLILVDVEMPGLNGYEVSRRLAELPATWDCPVIIMTADSTPEHEVAALDAGAVDFFSKPFNPPVVRARVRTQLRLQQQTRILNELANRDGLTGLGNRRSFDRVLAAEFERHRRQRQPLSLALVDIDHFKAYNDAYGHLEGDACLRRVAAAIGAAVRRPGEAAARYGGEEFAVILPHTEAGEARTFGEHLCASVRALGLKHGHSATAGHITISLGLSTLLPTAEDSALKLIEAADRALYQAKAAGRDRAVLAGEP